MNTNVKTMQIVSFLFLCFVIYFDNILSFFQKKKKFVSLRGFQRSSDIDREYALVSYTTTAQTNV